MLILYAVAAIVGGVLIATSIFLGDHDADADFDTDFDADADADLSLDADADADLDLDADADVSADGDGDASDGAHTGAWLPFLSLRFWTFFLCFFGLTGLVLTEVIGSGGLAAATAAISVGGFSGTLVSWLVRRLRSSEADSSVNELDVAGATGKLLLPVSPEVPGKLRVTMKGHTLDVPATTREGLTLERGEEVLVVRVVDGSAEVTPLAPSSHGCSASSRGRLPLPAQISTNKTLNKEQL